MIQLGTQEYLRNCEKVRLEMLDLEDIRKTKNFMKNYKIKCVKFNNTIDKNQGIRLNYAFLELSQDL